MQHQNLTPALSKSYKIVVFLINTNCERSINFAKCIADNIEVIYITYDEKNLELINHPNIKIVHLKNYNDSENHIYNDFKSFQIARFLKCKFKKAKLYENEILIIFNDINFTSVLSYFKTATAHFDNNKEINETFIREAFRKKLFTSVNCITTQTVRQQNTILKGFRNTLRIPDGVEISINNNINTNIEANPVNKANAGCNIPDISILNIDFIKEVALKVPDYNFIYVTKEPISPEIKYIHNLNFTYDLKNIVNYKLILLPFKDYKDHKIAQLLYYNLYHPCHIIAKEHPELDIHRNILTLEASTTDIITTLQELQTFKETNYIEKKLLIENSSWKARSKQLESAILAFN
jgi:hypothetical protein